MIITDLVRKGKSEQYKTYIDGEYVCLLEAEIIVTQKIKIGSEFDEHTFQNIREQSEKITCKSDALKFVSKCLKTRKQVYDHLKQKGFLETSIQNAIELLQNYGYINDKYYAESYIKTRTQNGKLYIKNALKSKGISDSIISSVLENFEVDSEEIVKIAQKFVKNKPKDIKLKQKLYRHLLSKGFEYGEASKAVDTVFKGSENDWD